MKFTKMILLPIVYIGLSTNIVSAGTIFSDQERSSLISDVLPNGLAEVWIEPFIQACWTDAIAGNDYSLSALYLIENSRKVIGEAAKRKSKALLSAKTSGEAYANMKTVFNTESLNELKLAVKTLPRSWKYCEKVFKENNIETSGD